MIRNEVNKMTVRIHMLNVYRKSNTRKRYVSCLLHILVFSWFCCQYSCGYRPTFTDEHRRQLYIRALEGKVQNGDSFGTEHLLRKSPIKEQSHEPSSSPTSIEVEMYEAGNLDKIVMGLTLSRGLHASLVAVVGYPVWFENGTSSEDKFLVMPDAAATFPTSDGGWIYTINSEFRLPKPLKRTSSADNLGGVSGIRFNKAGQAIGYQILLNDTYANCGGGRTPWGVSTTYVYQVWD
jgi:hypothetical protein